MKALTVFFAACAAICGYGYEPPVHTNSYTQNGVTYAQRGGLGASNYVAVAVNALENDYTALTNNSNFKSAVETVSPPAELPSKWALANVTNANGGAVTAADVNARPSSWTPNAADVGAVAINQGTTAATMPFKIKDADGTTALIINYTGLKYVDDYGDWVSIDGNGVTSQAEGMGRWTRNWRAFLTNNDLDIAPIPDSGRGVKSGGVWDWGVNRFLAKTDAATTYLSNSVASVTYETKQDATAKNNARIADITAVSNLVGNCRTKYDLAYYRSDWNVNKVAQQYIPALAALFEFRVEVISDFSVKGMIIYARNNSAPSYDWFPVAESVETYPTAEEVLAAETFTVGNMYDPSFSGIAGKTITKHYTDGTLATTVDLQGYVPTTRKINGQPLSGDITIQTQDLTQPHLGYINGELHIITVTEQ